MIPGERHNEDEIHLKALPEQIFVVFFQIDKSRNHKRAVPFRASFDLKRVNKILGSAVSKAALKSNRTRRVTCCLFSVCQNAIVYFHQSSFRSMKFPV